MNKINMQVIDSVQKTVEVPTRLVDDNGDVWVRESAVTPREIEEIEEVERGLIEKLRSRDGVEVCTVPSLVYFGIADAPSFAVWCDGKDIRYVIGCLNRHPEDAAVVAYVKRSTGHLERLKMETGPLWEPDINTYNLETTLQPKQAVFFVYI